MEHISAILANCWWMILLSALIAYLLGSINTAVLVTGIVTKGKKVTIACGEGVFPYMKRIMSMINEKFPNITINTRAIKNNFFGGGVNVSGLVTGGDLIDQLRDDDLGDRLIITSSMLRFENDLFLDDVSTDDVERELGVTLVPVNNNGNDLVEAVIAGKD